MVKYLVFLFFLVITHNSWAGVHHLKELPKNGEFIASKILCQLTSFNSLGDLGEDLKKKSINSMKENYTVKVALENGNKTDVCGLCHCRFKKQGKCPKVTFVQHLNDHWMFFHVLKELEAAGKSALSLRPGQTKEISSVNQLIHDENTCLACFRIMQPSNEDVVKNEGSNKRMKSHAGRHINFEERSDRICSSYAKSFEAYFSKLKLQDAVNVKKKFYEDGRFQHDNDKASGVLETKKKTKIKKKESEQAL